MRLHDLAHARSGDKGDVLQISVIAYDQSHYPHLAHHLGAAQVQEHLGGPIGCQVQRFELPELGALNFVLRGFLRGGVTRSLALDPHGKCMASVLLEIEIPDLIETAATNGGSPCHVQRPPDPPDLRPALRADRTRVEDEP
jgi:hypothetical protein